MVSQELFTALARHEGAFLQTVKVATEISDIVVATVLFILRF